MASKFWNGDKTYGTPAASFEGGKIWNGDRSYVTPGARYEGGKIWVGDRTYGTSDGRYEGAEFGVATGRTAPPTEGMKMARSGWATAPMELRTVATRDPMQAAPPPRGLS